MGEAQKNPEATWFGYAEVKPEEKTERVRAVFSSVAQKYDIMNDLMSWGLHRLWKDRFVRRVHPRAGQVLLDVAGGTGDIALRCAKATDGQAKIIVCDLNPDMLAVGRAKAVDQGWLESNGDLSWVTGNAEALPIPDASVDIVTIVFGLRNVTRIDTALSEFFRVLKPGGRFLCMEFSPDVRAEVKGIYDAYSFHVLPWLGEKVAGDAESYQYLAESIRQFPPREELKQRMEKVGFEKVSVESVLMGVAAIHEGWKL